MEEQPDISLFPGMLGELARAGFVDEAIKLAATWGGSKRYIPANPKNYSRLSKVIGIDAAEVLAEPYGGRPHDIPVLYFKGKKKLALKYLDHLNATDAARAVGCTARYVRMVRSVGSISESAGERQSNTETSSTEIVKWERTDAH